ncbi:cryptochrome/photolyase family protein [Shimia ponticola]|uniref:cryptochrome/photolyase family protein n=1 Tax=Shimia ponticola TaxID=2582893 RepID=UPI0011BF5051|nr:deoxyribodipyrimidine photo-lyase [Shimia ponticola]
MSEKPPILLWYRRDLRLSDHPALSAACASGHPVIPVFINDEGVDRLGAAPMWRLGLGVETLAKTLEKKGSRLILRKGLAQEVLEALVKETGACGVYWSRSYEPVLQDRDANIKSALKDNGVEARSFSGHLLFDPWSVQTKTGGFYKVYSPMWKAVKDSEIDAAVSAPSSIPAPDTWPSSDDLSDWSLGARMKRGADIVRQHIDVGEEAAQTRLGVFIRSIIDGYDTTRDLVAEDGTSRLSAHLSLGEISPRSCWHAGRRALEEGKGGAETFLKELVWREFAYHLLHHTPRITSDNWREEWDAFPWNEDERLKEVQAWKHGRTGIQFVDAGLREMYVTGTMHNRARMIVASYLTKHLLSHWKIGLAWFEDCLVDWDPASNAMGWQWSAGSGPDATPYFRVFNPVTQLDKFDKNRTYVSRWIAEGRSNPSDTALSYFDAIPESWNMSADDDYPKPVVAADEGRKRALNAYEKREF